MLIHTCRSPFPFFSTRFVPLSMSSLIFRQNVRLTFPPDSQFLCKTNRYHQYHSGIIAMFPETHRYHPARKGIIQSTCEATLIPIRQSSPSMIRNMRPICDPYVTQYGTQYATHMYPIWDPCGSYMVAYGSHMGSMWVPHALHTGLV